MIDTSAIHEALTAYRKQAFQYGWALTEKLQDRADAALTELEALNEELSYERDIWLRRATYARNALEQIEAGPYHGDVGERDGRPGG